MEDKAIMYDEFGNAKECKVLAIILNKYIVYSDINNNFPTNNLLVGKFNKMGEEVDLLPMDEVDWINVSEEYKKLCKEILEV